MIAISSVFVKWWHLCCNKTLGGPVILDEHAGKNKGWIKDFNSFLTLLQSSFLSDRGISGNLF